MWLMTRKATAHSGAIPSVGSTAQPLVVPEAHLKATFRFVTKVYDLVRPIQADCVIVRNGVTETNHQPGQDTIAPEPVLRIIVDRHGLSRLCRLELKVSVSTRKQEWSTMTTPIL